MHPFSFGLMVTDFIYLAFPNGNVGAFLVVITIGYIIIQQLKIFVTNLKSGMYYITCFKYLSINNFSCQKRICEIE
jgi:hypothetical protein